MGNSISDVNDNLKAQAAGTGAGPEIYNLVNPEGGELVRLMKIALNTKDHSAVDECIRTEVKKFVYNEGKGEQVKCRPHNLQTPDAINFYVSGFEFRIPHYKKFNYRNHKLL